MGKGGGSGGGKPDKSTVSHGNDASVEHRPYMPPSGGGQPHPASRDMTTPFPFDSFLPCYGI